MASVLEYERTSGMQQRGYETDVFSPGLLSSKEEPFDVGDRNAAPDVAEMATYLSVSDEGSVLILRQLLSLHLAEEQDEVGVLRPTPYAFQETVELLLDAAKIFLAIQSPPGSRRCTFPAGCVTTDSEGGVRIEWLNGDRAVRLVVRSKEDQQRYIYHQIGEDYDVDYNVSADILAYWLRVLGK